MVIHFKIYFYEKKNEQQKTLKPNKWSLTFINVWEMQFSGNTRKKMSGFNNILQITFIRYVFWIYILDKE
jgi:hypothetical protein